MANNNTNNNKHGDLSKREGSMSWAITKHSAEIMGVQTVPGMILTLSKIFAKYDINTPASNRLLSNVEKSRSVTDAQFKVYNSCLAGAGDAVIH